jgi:ArsR family transcriptional regulator
MLLRLLPPMVIADLGAGEGTLSLMLAQGAEKVIAVDNALKMIEYTRSVAQRNAIENLDYRFGDLEDLPIADGEAGIALMHQSLHHALHPAKAIAESWRILQPGGRLVIMDLMKHHFEQARELYADVWLGFSQAELKDLLLSNGFSLSTMAVVHREQETPHFETILAIAQKPLA